MIARASRAAALVGGLATLTVALLISLDVLLRYFFGRPLLFIDEVVSFLQVLLIFGGLAYTFTVGGHVRVDLITAHLSPTVRAWLRVGTLALGLTFVLVVAWVTTQSALTAHHYGRVSAVMLYPIWIPMLLMPGGLLLMAATLVSALARQWRAIRGPAAGRHEVGLSSEDR